MARVTLKALHKVYENGFVAVKDASFEVKDGEFVVLVGPSGCGKSTTLRMLAGLETVTAGTLMIGDAVVNDVPPKDRDIAMVFQNYALYPHMTVFENMAFGLKLRKFPKQEIAGRVRNAAEILGIEDILDRKPKQLSGGQRQRVAVGRAIVRKPKVFLFDEPLSNLDAKLRVQMRTEISKLHQRLNATMVYVTHDQVEAMTMGDRIVVLNKGEIQQIDTPLNLYNYPKNIFVAGFIGSPAMNFIEGRLYQEDDSLVFRSQNNTVRLTLHEQQFAGILAEHAGQEVTIGIRPENIIVASEADDPKAPPIECNLDVIEPMGSEIVIYTRSEEVSIVARIAPQSLPQVGSKVLLTYDSTKLHIFNTNTGLRIDHNELRPAA